MKGAARNPFCAARFAPGALPWFDDGTGELDGLLDAALRRGGRLQVVGPHGSGKSTLLQGLEFRARARGLSAVGLRGSRASAKQLARALHADLVLLDEAEELGALGWCCLAVARLAGGTSLVVSAHRDFGFETLARRTVGPDLALQVVARLLENSRWLAPSKQELETRLQAHDGNLREVLFDLYDAVELGSLEARAGAGGLERGD